MERRGPPSPITVDPMATRGARELAHGAETPADASSVDALASVRMKQMHHSVRMPAQPHRFRQLRCRARVAPRHQLHTGARVGVDVRLAAEILDKVNDDGNATGV